MTSEANPYQSPSTQVAAEEAALRLARKVDYLSIVCWPLICLGNMLMPFTFAAALMNEQRGQIGAALAAAMLLIAGWVLCWLRPVWVRTVMVGAVVTGLSQIFPILQMIAGIIAIAVAALLGLGVADDGPAEMPAITSELGAFVIGIQVGLLLLIVATGIGLFLRLLLPKEWFTLEDAATEGVHV